MPGMYDFTQTLETLQLPGTLGLPEHPITEILKLVAAAGIGFAVTAVRKRQHGRPLPLPLEHAMMLLSLTGALMMIIIGNSLARALGIAGAATIIRFRTPVDDPRDTTLFLILLGLGMTCGVGAFALAGLATFFVCAFLLFLNKMSRSSPRLLDLEIVSQTAQFPSASVENVLTSRGVTFELHEMTMDQHASATYLVNVRNGIDLNSLSGELMNGTADGLRSVSWSEKKWMRQ
jgi:hypothetical protein